MISDASFPKQYSSLVGLCKLNFRLLFTYKIENGFGLLVKVDALRKEWTGIVKLQVGSITLVRLFEAV
jgi:hypothetical protein